MNKLIPLSDDLSAMARGFRGEIRAEALKVVGMGAKEDAAEAVIADLGDQTMSNWWRRKPIKVEARFDLVGESAVDISPTPRNRGPWRVLEEGRQYGSATDLVFVGRARKDGTRRGKSRGRNQGSTPGKDTWSDAERLIEKRTPARAETAIYEAARDFWMR